MGNKMPCWWLSCCLISVPAVAANSAAIINTGQLSDTQELPSLNGRVAPVNIAQRVSYAETGATGQGVTETSDNKAGAEIAAVWDYVKGILDG